jgi:Uma2 family endonuclease
MQTVPRTYEEVVREHPELKLEMYDGELREKPALTIGHNRLEIKLLLDLARQLNGTAYEVRLGQAPVQRTDRDFFLPDVYIVPRHPIGTPLDEFEVFVDPLPFLAEVWSPSTGVYDIDRKLPEYRKRGDLEIWRLHPFERTVTAWRRQPNGHYTETVFSSGVVQLHALPEIRIRLDDLFDIN